MPADKGNDVNKAKSSSPYKKINEKNTCHTGYISMSKLAPNKAYQMIDLVQTNHVKFGPGELATLSRNGQRWKVQIPSKYIREMDTEDFDTIRQDIAKMNYPYLIFREVMADGSFRMDLIPKSVDIVDQFQKDLDVPPVSLDTSGDSQA